MKKKVKFGISSMRIKKKRVEMGGFSVAVVFMVMVLTVVMAEAVKIIEAVGAMEELGFV